MQILVMLRMIPTATPDRPDLMVKSKASEALVMNLNGTLRSAHFIQTPGVAPFPSGMVLPLDADSRAAAQAMVTALPMLESSGTAN
jgi:hypothetical protein